MIEKSHVPNVIIGAGPYGLSVAAHLRAAAIPFRIFGFPMHRWLEQMPGGMFLKSEGQASSLSEPTGRFTLGRYCRDNGLPYGDRGVPVAIETFVRYGLEFQRRFVPEVEQIAVKRVTRTSEGFRVELENGSEISTRSVVIAAGLEDTEYVPPVLTGFSKSLVSHCSEHSDLSAFEGRDVTIVGAGQSAIETAALLHEGGVKVRLIARIDPLQWNLPPRLGQRSLYHRFRYPVSNLGEGIQMWLYSNVPNLYRYLPRHRRLSQVHRVLGPAGAWWLRDRIEGKVEIRTGSEIVKAEAIDGRVRLTVRTRGSETYELLTDHVIAATGYRYDLQRLSFLDAELRRAIRTENFRPDLSPDFETNIPGLFFAGMASAYRFGPAMRFIEGAQFTARTLAAHLSARRSASAVMTTRVATTAS